MPLIGNTFFVGLVFFLLGHFSSAKVNFFVMSKQSATFTDKRITKSTWKSTLTFKLIIKTFFFGVATMFTWWFDSLSSAISFSGDKKAFRNMTRPRCEWLRKVFQSVHHVVSPAPLIRYKKWKLKQLFQRTHNGLALFRSNSYEGKQLIRTAAFLFFTTIETHSVNKMLYRKRKQGTHLSAFLFALDWLGLKN